MGLRHVDVSASDSAKGRQNYEDYTLWNKYQDCEEMRGDSVIRDILLP